MLDPAASQAAELAADRFALDVLGRIGRVPSGIATFFELAGAYAPHRTGADADPAYAAAARQTHPLSLARLRQVAADIGGHAPSYARDEARDAGRVRPAGRADRDAG